MKSVFVLTGFGLAVLAALACRSSTPSPNPAPVKMRELPPVVEIVQEIEPDSPEGRVLTREETRALIRTGDLQVPEEPEKVVVYDVMTRAGPIKHLKVKQQKLEPVVAAPKAAEEVRIFPSLVPVSKELRLYSRAGPWKNRPVKPEVPVVRKD